MRSHSTKNALESWALLTSFLKFVFLRYSADFEVHHSCGGINGAIRRKEVMGRECLQGERSARRET